jgi:P-type E1-E2 ATPase
MPRIAAAKGAIVDMMRDKTGKLALAIGDGADDVGMILQADVGVGVSGKENRQAVLVSDDAIAQFRYSADSSSSIIHFTKT